MNKSKAAPVETVVEAEPETQQPEAQPEPTNENPLARFDGDTLRAIGVSEVAGSGMSAFLPANMAEAMEFAKLMAASNSVPPHLRGNRGDCLAIVIQSVRWGADPFAVANKTYFVNNRMAFEAQLVAAVVNTSKVLDGRLQVSWQGAVGKAGFQCTVRGKIRGDEEVHELIQEIDTITTRNSPLWKQSQRIQLGYYTMRGWSRLYTPEVLLGIYTPDELESNPGAPGTQTVIPPRPTRASVSAQAKEFKDAEARSTGRIPDEEVDHDAETGEVIEHANEPTNDGPAQPAPPADAPTSPSQPAAQVPDNAATSPAKVSHEALANNLIAAITKTGMLGSLNKLIKDRAGDIDLIRTDDPESYKDVMSAIEQRRVWFAR